MGSTKVSSRESLEAEVAEMNLRLNARLQEINTIYTVGKSVASSLDAEEVLARAIIASVNLTQADTGFVILKEEGTLVARVLKHLDEPAPRHLHDPVEDAMAWQVVRSGRPAMLNRETRVATGLLARTLLYVPLQAPATGTVGVLGVVNHLKDASFSESQLFTLSSVADFAAIALENARLFALMGAEHSRLTAILQHATEAIIVTDLEDRLWLWSDTAARLFQMAPDVQGQPLTEHIQNRELCELFSQGEQEKPTGHEEIVLEDGAIYNAQLSTIDGVGRVAVMQDITHLKELDRLKSEFVSTVSHDLRTPLTTIQGYVSLLDRVGPLNEMQTEFVGKALTSLDHITALISDLLDIGRIEAGYDLEMRLLRIDTLVEAVVEANQMPSREAGIMLSVDLPDHELWVWGNARRLRQVLDNLISNAVKYNRPEGWVRVGVRRDEGCVIVSVADSGIGIPVAEQSRVFDRLYRVQIPETEEISGTGLGLAIVKSVVEKHRGRVWVESVFGVGSTFTFVLPAQEPGDG